MKKLLLFTMIFFLNYLPNYSQSIANNLIVGPIGQLIPRPNPRTTASLSCNVNGINITTGGTSIAIYSNPLLPQNNNCGQAATFFGLGNFTSASNTGTITYTFSQPITSAIIGYSAANDDDIGLIAVNNLGSLLLSNPCGVDIIGNNIIDCNYAVGSYGNIRLTVSSDTPFTTITLTNIGGPVGSGWVIANPCNFIINPPLTTAFYNCPKIYLDPLRYHATQAQTTTFSLFNAAFNTTMNPLCDDEPCLINGVPCSASNVTIEPVTPLSFGSTINTNGTVTIAAGVVPFQYTNVFYRLRSIANPFHVSEIYRVSFTIVEKVFPAYFVIYLQGSPPIEPYINGSRNVLTWNGNALSKINMSVTGACGLIGAQIGFPTDSETVTVTETTNPENAYYTINPQGSIVFRPGQNAGTVPPPTSPEVPHILTYKMCINNTGMVEFCREAWVSINYHFASNKIEQPSNDVKKLIVSPNPSSNGIFTLTLKEPIKSGTIEIYNMIGQQMHNQKVSNLIEYTLYLANLPKGSYLLKVSDGQEVISKNIILK
jgi:hypothetical protein